ncbi:MAG: TIGR03936 family radical SAM-associated protein [Treponema sp.]|jgi:radical SAM superfamily enzyme YgiQ (UPF0313 family)|nr:TIGR03936 family radical SAM-associated protein [Treponema sp.]
MSNQALRILYNRLNSMPGISCDRAFAPAPDFEALLRQQGIPLYGLDTGLVLADADLFLFTLGYELGATAVLTMLDLAGVPIHARERREGNPLVVIGGPCVSNPLPYAAFADAFWIGEAEAGFFDVAAEAREIKKRGGSREEILGIFAAHPSVWALGKGKARRAVDLDFPHRKPEAAVFPVPSLKVVQHHGAVEIMRGCPNGCRFCHAGYWYRPMRQKSAAVVQAEAAEFINHGGYREISLSSLSTGDYCHIANLVDALNSEFSSRHVSFQLPSLRVSTFSLPLLEKISEVRRSGLTFAVETPEDFWQLAINKEVSLQSVIANLKEAKKNGWRGAKFYFMIGLPVADENFVKTEEEAIVEFVLEAAGKTGMHFAINVGTFVPKPHTPFQRAPQLSEAGARKKLDYIRDRLKPRGHKVGVQDPFISVIEGLISRGDERAGAVIEEAWKQGCRLDAWTEFLKRDVWTELLDRNTALVHEIMGPKLRGQLLPWAFIDPGFSENFFTREFEKSEAGEITSPCINNCMHRCGICGPGGKVVQTAVGIVKNSIHDDNLLHPVKDRGVTPGIQPEKRGRDPGVFKTAFSFSKQGPAIYHSHLSVIEIFSMALIRSGFPVRYTRGFNPLPCLEIASPLALGITALGEIAFLETEAPIQPETFVEKMNICLPQGLCVKSAMNVYVPSGKKKHSLASLLWGAVYDSGNGKQEAVPFREEKCYRQKTVESGTGIFALRRVSVLAKDPGNPEKQASFFEILRKLYPENNEEK